MVWRRDCEVWRIELPFMKKISFRYVAFVLGCLLLVTGGLKAQATFSDKPVESYLFGSRWELLAIAEFEFILGTWLITGVYPRLARQCALLTFLGFLGVSLMTAFNGERSCSCFGELKVSPWIAAFIDSAALIALLLCQPGVNNSTNTFSPLLRAFLVVYPMALLGLPIALAVSSDTNSLLLLPSKHVVDLGEVPAGEWRTASLDLSNKGDKPVVIEKFESSCRCLSLECVPRVVPASGTAQLNVTLDLGKEPSFVGNLRIRAEGKTRAGALALSIQVKAKVQESSILPQPQGTALAP